MNVPEHAMPPPPPPGAPQYIYCIECLMQQLPPVLGAFCVDGSYFCAPHAQILWGVTQPMAFQSGG